MSKKNTIQPIWTLHRNHVNGTSDAQSYGTFDEARAAASEWTHSDDCALAVVSFGPDWSPVTVFMYKPMEVRHDKPVQISRNTGRHTPQPRSPKGNRSGS